MRYVPDWVRGATVVVALVFMAAVACTSPPPIKSTADAVATVAASLTAVANTAADLWDLSEQTGEEFITAAALAEMHREISHARDLLEQLPPDLASAQEILKDRKRLLLLILANLPEG